MYRLFKRGLFIMVVWGLPMVCVVLAAVGLFRRDVAWLERRTSTICITNDFGGLWVWQIKQLNPDNPIRVPPWGNFGIARDRPDARRGASRPHDFIWIPRYSSDRFFKRVELPWLLILPIVFIPAAVYYGPPMKRRRRRKLGLCTRCGYDLRGQSDASANCPECGTAAT